MHADCPGFLVWEDCDDCIRMTVSLRDARVHRGDREWIESAYRDYLEDLAPDASGLFPMLEEIGHSRSDQIERWFSDRKLWPLTILRSGIAVGFALIVVGPLQYAQSARLDYRLAEFFIGRDYRRLGIGAAAAPLIFNRFSGRWCVSEQQRNRGAVRFWRRIVERYTGGQYQERLADGEVRQFFTSGELRRPGRVPE